MGLFSDLWKKLLSRRRTATERALHFNKERLQTEMQRHAVGLNEYRGDTGHKLFVDFVQTMLHAEILKLSHVPTGDHEAFVHQRGKIAALREVLDLREKFIQDKKQAKKTGAKDDSVRTYIHRTPANSAGLSV